MIREKFILKIQGYYTQYNPTQKKYVEKWVGKKSENILPELFAELLKSFTPSSTVPVPGINNLESALKTVRENRSEKPPEYVHLLPEREVPKDEIEQMRSGWKKLLKKTADNRDVHEIDQKKLKEVRSELEVSK